MAAVISKDPFVDPTSTSTSKSHRPPPPPPQSTQSQSQSSNIKNKLVSKSQNNSQNDITEAVRDTVLLRNQQDHSTRTSTKMNRSHTPAAQPSSAPQPSRPSARKATTDDSTNITEKPRSSAKSRSKKGSQHADVIDRLDFTGVGPMFHHDGPFDACAPSRNKHRNKAPMYAWADDPNNVAYGDSAYPAPAAYTAFSNNYPEPPKKKVDAIAEAWGIHEPEPFEEFFAGGGSGRTDGDTPTSSIYNGKDPSRSTRRPRDDRAQQQPRTARRSLVPPPQPIFAADPIDDSPAQGSPPPPSPGFPKRSKSLMHRIRKMRDSPNVPVGTDYEQPPSPTSPVDPSRPTRPTHRNQNSFLGRFAGGSRANQPPTDNTGDKPDPYVFIDPQNNKELPPPPPMAESYSSQPESADSPTSPGLGRKTSLMKKVGKVVRGSK